MTVATLAHAPVPECECGREKAASALCCSECAYLDGTASPQYRSKYDDIIGILRIETDGVSVQRLVQLTRRDKRSLLRSLALLQNMGRVLRREIPSEGSRYIVLYYLTLRKRSA